MGIYYTCEFCGIAQKGMLPSCSCHEFEYKKILSKIIGSTLINNSIKNDQMAWIIVTHYVKNNENIYTMAIHPTDYMQTNILFEINEDRYKQFINEQSNPTQTSNKIDLK